MRLVLVSLAAVAIAIAAYFLLASGAEDDAAGFGGTYRSSQLGPPARVITLELGANGAAVLRTDFSNGQSSIKNEGAWVSDGSELVVTLSTMNGNPLLRAVVIPFVPAGSKAIKTTGAQELIAGEGVTFTRQ